MMLKIKYEEKKVKAYYFTLFTFYFRDKEDDLSLFYVF